MCPLSGNPRARALLVKWRTSLLFTNHWLIPSLFLGGINIYDTITLSRARICGNKLKRGMSSFLLVFLKGLIITVQKCNRTELLEKRRDIKNEHFQEQIPASAKITALMTTLSHAKKRKPRVAKPPATAIITTIKKKKNDAFLLIQHKCVC